MSPMSRLAVGTCSCRFHHRRFLRLWETDEGQFQICTIMQTIPEIWATAPGQQGLRVHATVAIVHNVTLRCACDKYRVHGDATSTSINGCYKVCMIEIRSPAVGWSEYILSTGESGSTRFLDLASPTHGPLPPTHCLLSFRALRPHLPYHRSHLESRLRLTVPPY
jgi:hypothetical protein